MVRSTNWSLYTENLIIQPFLSTGCQDLVFTANSKKRFEGTDFKWFFCILTYVCNLKPLLCWCWRRYLAVDPIPIIVCHGYPVQHLHGPFSFITLLAASNWPLRDNSAAARALAKESITHRNLQKRFFIIFSQ